MNKYRCDGQEVQVGKTVLVRERTELLDCMIYSGVVMQISENEGGSSERDKILVRDDTGSVRCTYRHCVYATKENIFKLRYEIKSKICSLENKEDFLRRAMREQHKYIQHLCRDIKQNFEEIDRCSVKLEKVVKDFYTTVDTLEDLESTLWLVDDNLRQFDEDIQVSQDSLSLTIESEIPHNMYFTAE